MMVVFHDEEQNKKLAEIHGIQEESAVQSLAAQYGVGYVDLTSININTDALLLIPQEIAQRDRVALFAMLGKKLSIAVQSPAMDGTIDRIDELEQKGYEVKVYMVSMRSLQKAWARYADVSGSLRTTGGLLDISDESLQQLAQEIHTNQDIASHFTDILQSKEVHKVSKLMEIIFGAAIATKSSDVHIEAAEDHARLRFRQDGVLQDIVMFPLDMYKSINSRIKLLSELKLTDAMLAQDGRFTIIYKGMEIEVRTSLIPGPYGESIVMRILNPEGLTVELEKLGIQPKLFALLEQEIKKPNGMILTTGPTGSGKTTTLYSFLKQVYTPEIKILTIEDPIEYHLPGITQTQADHEHGYDFSSGLRAALRQDPDVIMVGEIRDKETASTAVNASLTGHLVLSTLHTNNAAGAIPRLIELGVSPKILPDALTVAMAQRLLRRLCPDCKQSYTPDMHEERLIRAILKNAEQSGKQFSDSGVTNSSQITLYKPVGCDTCDHIGYKGRVGLYEAIIVDDIVAEAIAKNPSERDIKNSALHQGNLTLIEDGIEKVLSGITSMEELQSVIDLAEDLPEGWHQSERERTMPNNTHTTEPIAPVDTELYLMTHPADEDTVSNISPIPTQVPSDTVPIIRTSDESITLPVRELALLTDYLALLEEHQREYPEQGIKEKITEAKETIIDLLRHNNPKDWTVIDPKKAVHREVSAIMDELTELERHQSRRPDVGIAHELQKIRNTIENLVAKE